MSDEARTLMLAHLKEELDLKRTAPNADAAYRSGLLASADAIAKQNYELSQQSQTLQGGLVNGWHDMTKTVNDTGDSIKTVMTDTFKGAEDAFTKFVETGKLNIADLTKTIETDVLHLAEKLLIEQPILAALGMGGQGNVWSSMFGGGQGGTTTGGVTIPGSTSGGGGNNGSGATGILGSLFGAAGKFGGSFGDTISNAYSGSFLQSIFGGGTPVDPFTISAGASALPSMADAGPSVLGAFATAWHTGGKIGYDQGAHRTVDPSLFFNAPRFHSGLASDEFAAILQKGERVLTQKQEATVSALAKSAPGSDSGKGGDTHIHNWNFPPGTDVDSFRRSQGQISVMVARSMGNSSNRLGARG